MLEDGGADRRPLGYEHFELEGNREIQILQVCCLFSFAVFG